MILNKEQKTSEFRQAWIDGLRQDLAAFFACARAFARATQELQVLGRGNKEAQPFAMTNEKMSEIRYQIAEARYRIQLRLNQSEHEHKELLRLMQVAITEQNNWLASNGDVSKTLDAIETIAAYAPQILKSEWERVKKGEFAFRMVKNWIAPLIILTSSVFLVLLVFGVV